MAGPDTIPPTGETFGAIQNSNTISVFLFGVLTLQVYYYFAHHSGDGPHIKRLTIMYWVLELIHTIAILHTAYFFTFDLNPFSFLTVNPDHIWSVVTFFITCTTLGVCSQIFYGLWIRLISRNWAITAVCWILALTQLALSVAQVALVGKGTLATFLTESTIRSLILGVGISRLAMDAISSASICYYMIRAEGKDGVGFGKGILLFVETGMFSSVIQVVSLAISIWSTQNFIWLGLQFIRTKVLVNSVLLALNSRHLWKSELPLVDLGKRAFLPKVVQSKENNLTLLNITIERDNLSSCAPSYCNSDQGSLAEKKSLRSPFIV